MLINDEFFLSMLEQKFMKYRYQSLSLKNSLYRFPIISLILSTLLISPYGLSKEMKEKNIFYNNVLELSHPIKESIPLWPGDPAVSFKSVATMSKDGYYLRQFTIGEHSATHMNAPNSFIDNGQGIDSFPASSLVLPAIVINVTAAVKNNPDYIISIKDIQSWERQNGQIPTGSLVFFNTGWGSYWETPEKFINQDKQGVLHFPGISGDVAEFLITQRNIGGLGIDTHGLDPSQSEIYRTNTLLATHHKIALECVANLDKMPTKGATIAIGLLRLDQGSGAPVSITAFLPD